MRDKIIAVVSLVLAAATASDAFSPIFSRNIRSDETVPMLKKNVEVPLARPQDMVKTIATSAAVVAAAAVVHVSGAGAATMPNSFGASSVHIAETVKTFDMSLPSYDKISEPKALVVTKEEEKPDKEKTEGAGIPFSFSASRESKKAEKLAKKAKKMQRLSTSEEGEDKEKARNEKIKVVDIDMPSYSDSTSGPTKSVFSL